MAPQRVVCVAYDMQPVHQDGCLIDNEKPAELKKLITLRCFSLDLVQRTVETPCTTTRQSPMVMSSFKASYWSQRQPCTQLTFAVHVLSIGAGAALLHSAFRSALLVVLHRLALRLSGNKESEIWVIQSSGVNHPRLPSARQAAGHHRIPWWSRRSRNPSSASLHAPVG